MNRPDYHALIDMFKNAVCDAKGEIRAMGWAYIAFACDIVEMRSDLVRILTQQILHDDFNLLMDLLKVYEDNFPEYGALELECYLDQ